MATHSISFLENLVLFASRKFHSLLNAACILSVKEEYNYVRHNFNMYVRHYVNFRRELRQFGVSVHIIEPGGYNTPIHQLNHDLAMKAWDQLTPDVQTRYGKEFLNHSK